MVRKDGGDTSPGWWLAGPAAAMAVGLVSTPAMAHVGVGHGVGTGAGFLHPLSGLDHVLAMVAVGVWGGQMGGRARWAVPAAFLVVLFAGALAGMTTGSIAAIEIGIAVSVVAAGGLVALAWAPPLGLAAAIAGLFALFHGHAHGAEMPLTASGLSFAGGFLAATALLLVAGLALSWAIDRLPGRRAGVAVGAGVAGLGVFLMAV